MNWLNENTAAIQAVASVAGLIVTCLLALLTRRYVLLTREIAESNSEQVKQMKDAARSAQQRDASVLESLALRIRTDLGQRLNSDVPKHRDFRNFFSLAEHDITELHLLARQVGGQAITSASGAVSSLREILGMIQKAKNINEGTGWQPTEEEVQRWKMARDTSHRELQELETICKQVVTA